MSFSTTMDCPASQVWLTKAHKRFVTAIKSVGTGERIFIPPVEDAKEPLLRVLIVDDHRATTDTLYALATRWGHDVRRAYDGVTGLALAAAFCPDVLVLDMLMRNVSGFEVARTVRMQERLRHCFIVAVTGRTDTKHRDECYEAGVDLFLIKPVHPSHLETLLSLEASHVQQTF